MNTLTFEGNTYWLIEIQNSTWIMHQEEPYKGMGAYQPFQSEYWKEQKVRPYEYKSLNIGGKFYAFKLIENE